MLLCFFGTFFLIFVLHCYCFYIYSPRGLRCTEVDEILHKHVPWQPQKFYWISKKRRLKVKLRKPDFRIFYHCEIRQKSLLSR